MRGQAGGRGGGAARTVAPLGEAGPAFGRPAWMKRGLFASSFRDATETARAAASLPRANDEARGPQPRPTNGILLAMTVMNSTLASSGRLAM